MKTQTLCFTPEDRPFGGDSTDFSEVVSPALSTLQDGAVVTFSPGEYHFWPDKSQRKTLYVSNTDSEAFPEKSIGIWLERKQNITLRGEDALLIFHGSMVMLAMRECQNIRVEGLAFDYACPSAIDATVLEYTEENGRGAATVSYPPVYTALCRYDAVYWQSEPSQATGQALLAGRKRP